MIKKNDPRRDRGREPPKRCGGKQHFSANWLSIGNINGPTLCICYNASTYALLRFGNDSLQQGSVRQLQLDHLHDLDEKRMLDEDEVVGRDAEAVVVGGLQRMAMRDAAHYPTRFGNRTVA